MGRQGFPEQLGQIQLGHIRLSVCGTGRCSDCCCQPLWKKHGWPSSSPSPGPPSLPFGRSPPYKREGWGGAGVRRSVSSFDFLVCGWGKEEVYLRISEHLCFVSLCVYLKRTF